MDKPAEPETIEVVGEIQSSELWNPKTFEEWSRREQIKAFLTAWTAQANHERVLRGRCAWMIFGLSSVQTISSFALIFTIGIGMVKIDPVFLRILYPCLLGQIFGLFFVMAKYLFNKPFHLDPAAFLSNAVTQDKSPRTLAKSKTPPDN